MTRTEFNALIARNDEVGKHSIGRALVHLLNRQTEDEKATNQTRHHNNRGFTSGDGRRGAITAKFYLKHRNLLDWQIAYWRERDAKGRTRIGKYYRQIQEEAMKKAG
jgi:hypothetical protein